MTRQFCFTLEDKPGGFAKIAEVLGNANINIEGVSGVTSNNNGVIRLLVNNESQAEELFNSSGFDFTTEEVLLLNLDNRPGALSRATAALFEENVNLFSLYLTMNGDEVIQPDNVEKARSVLSKLGCLKNTPTRT